MPNKATMTVHKTHTHKDIRGIRGLQRWAPGVAGKIMGEAENYRGLVITLWFRNEWVQERLISRLDANPKKVFLPKAGERSIFPISEVKIAVLTHDLKKNILNKTLSRFCSDPAALPVFLLDDSPFAAGLADVIWVVGEDGEVEEEVSGGCFF